MVDFQETAMRHRCRNAKCRSKLSTPVSNLREAFCARGCHISFYRTHCRVCEAPIEQPKSGGERFICKKSACFNAWKANSGFGRYHLPSGVKTTPETPIKPGIQKPHKGGRAWGIVAGSALTPGQFLAATVADGPDCQWANGAYERTEAANRKAMERYLADIQAEANRRDAVASLNHCSECGQDHDLTDQANPTLCYPCFHERKLAQRVSVNRPDLFIPDDLSIPDFLLRQPPKDFAKAA
jgi:hypothetical protein